MRILGAMADGRRNALYNFCRYNGKELDSDGIDDILMLYSDKVHMARSQVLLVIEEERDNRINVIGLRVKTVNGPKNLFIRGYEGLSDCVDLFCEIKG